MEKKKKSSKAVNKVPKKERKKVGRPTSVTPETLAKLEQAFSLGCSDLEACIHADIAKSTLYDYQGRHPEFAERKEMLKQKLVLKARTVVANALEKEDENTAKWYLERKARDEFAAKQEVAVGNLESSPFKIEIID